MTASVPFKKKKEKEKKKKTKKKKRRSLAPESCINSETTELCRMS